MEGGKFIIFICLLLVLLLPGCELAANILATGLVIGIVIGVLIIALIIWAIGKFMDI